MVLCAQDTPEPFRKRCAACHGQSAEGTNRGPGLSGSRRLRSRSTEQIGQLIRKGIPAGGMPAFDIPAPELQELASFVHSLNAPAAENPAAGDAAAGERFFFGEANCGSCHMVRGRGKAVGPDLSSTGELTVREIREALLEPDRRISPGYDLVTVTLRDGATIRGFARQRSSFDLQLQDLDGKLHPIEQSRIVAVREEKRSLMPPLQTSSGNLRDLTAYLSRLEGVQPGMRPASQTPGHDFAPGDWPSYDGSLTGNRYSPLSQIDSGNVNRLALAWMAPIPHAGLEATPLVVDGIMYVSAANEAFALDALTGREIWQYSRPRTPGLVGDAALGTNRGMALHGDKVFMVTDNAHLIALNRTTGRLVWDAVMPDEPQHYGSTVAPLVVKDLVIAGVSGGDWGIRGFLSAYHVATGERAWRFWTIPRRGEPGSNTWKGKDPEFGGGSTWVTGSYDAETDTLFWSTATPFPVTDDRDRPGDNLYTDCLLAFDPATGRLKWHYQFTPHDVRAYDATEPNVIVNAPYRGRDRRLLLHADRNGFFYVFDRNDGQLLLAKPFVRVTWADGIGPDGRPRRRSAQQICPADEATNYNAAVFSPVTKQYYLMAVEECESPRRKYLRALDIETGEKVWEVPQTGTAESKHWAGLLGTAGGVLFYGEPGGAFVAASEQDGRTLWHFPANAVIKASPVAYTVDGRQFVAIAAGSNVLAFALAASP
ncbi:MAG: PQQ-binding-like beta-propeller repeat protein [Bryobacteraceae bacterium]